MNKEMLKILDDLSKKPTTELALQIMELSSENLILEQQCKKQKEVIDKANKYLHTRGIQRCYNGKHYRGLDGLQVQVLEDILKEVQE